MANVQLDNDQVLIQQPASFVEYWLAVKRRRLLVVVITMASLCVAAAMAWLWPYRYAAVVRLQVRPAESKEMVLVERARSQQAIETVLAQRTLETVVQRLDLCNQWAVGGEPMSLPDAVWQLRRKTNLVRKTDSSVVEVIVTDGTDGESMKLAQAIADVYLEQQTADAHAAREAAVAGLQRELADRQAALAESRRQSDALRLKLKLAAEQGPADDAAIASLQQQAAAAKLELLVRDGRTAAMEAAAKQRRYWTFALLANDPAVNSLMDQQTLVQQQIDRSPRLGANHPQMERLSEQLAMLTAQLDARVQGRLAAAHAEREAAAARLGALQSQASGWKQLASTVAADEASLRVAEQRVGFLQLSCDALESQIAAQSPNLEPVPLPLTLIDTAQVARRPFGSLMLTTLATALLLGVGLGIGAAITLNRSDHSFKHLADVERTLRLPVVGVVGLLRPHATDAARTAHTEGFRLLRNQVECARMDSPFKSLCVVSAAADEGKSSAVAQLASVWVELGLRVLVVDTDLRNPSLHRLLGGSNDVGLADFLARREPLDRLVQPTNVPGLSLIAAGRMSDDGVITPALIRQLVATVSRQYDLVLYDTAAALAVSDSILVAREVGTCLLLTQHHAHPQHMARRAMRMIQRAGGHFVGVMVNKVHADEQELFFGYDTKYYYYARPTLSSPAAGPAATRRAA